MKPSDTVRLLRWCGHTLPDTGNERLQRFAAWLGDEAIPAGGLGPGESKRIWDRHIHDSLSLSCAWSKAPESLTDLGSGVGLPGIPLAVLWPGTKVELVDRSGRRVELAERAVRVLGLDNVVVRQSDLHQARDLEAVVTRATVAAGEIAAIASSLRPGGLAAVAWSRRQDPPAPPAEAELLRVPPQYLDGGSWILIMQNRAD